MGSLGNPKTWVPYLNNKDCSQGFCSLYCPQWCYIIYPPPPPPPLAFLRGGPSAGISPLVVAIIGVVASAFLLVGYYAIISKYCGRGAAADERRSSSAAADRRSDYAADDDDEPPLHEPWHAAAAGLDEAAIQAIAAREYKRGDGSVDGTDCSVCLSEFEEGESVRLLPKCGHAFHIQCIDTWLRSHSNCPLCRAGVVVVVVAAAAGLPPEGGASGDESSSAATSEEDSGVPGQSSSRPGDDHEAENNVAHNAAAPKSSDDPSSVRGALGDLEERHAVMIEVRDEIRRSVSMDFSRRGRVSVAEILRTDCEYCEEEEQEEEGGGGGGEDHHVVEVEECCVERGGCSKFVSIDKVNDECGHRRKGVLHCVVSPVAMKRSVSSGRFFLRRNTVINPL